MSYSCQTLSDNRHCSICRSLLSWFVCCFFSYWNQKRSIIMQVSKWRAVPFNEKQNVQTDPEDNTDWDIWGSNRWLVTFWYLNVTVHRLEFFVLFCFVFKTKMVYFLSQDNINRGSGDRPEVGFSLTPAEEITVLRVGASSVTVGKKFHCCRRSLQCKEEKHLAYYKIQSDSNTPSYLSWLWLCL